MGRRVIVYSFRYFTAGKKTWVEIESTSASIRRDVKGLIVTDSLVYKTYNTGVINEPKEEGSTIKNGAYVGTFICTKDASLEEVEVEKVEDISKIKLSKNAVLNLVEEDFERLKTALRDGNKAEAKEIKLDLAYNLEFLDKLSDNSEFEFNNVSDVPIKMIGSTEAKANEEFKLISAESGYISYYVDKYDGIISYDGRYGFKYDEIFGSISDPVTTLGTTLRPNQVAFKIIGKDKWHLLLDMKIEDLDKFSIERKINLDFLDKNVVGIVVDKYKTQSNGILAVEVDVFFGEFFQKRIVDVSVGLNEIVGLKIPVLAVEYDENGNKGVFVSTVDGDEVFRPVEIIDENPLKGDDEELYYIVTPNVITTVDEAGNSQSIDTVSVGDKVLVRGK